MLLNQNQELRPLLAQVQALSRLQRHFSSVAPASLAQASRVLGLQQGILTVAVANATLAAKLRQHGPELATRLHELGCEVSGIRVKVQVSPDLRRPPPMARKLSKTAQQALLEFSRQLDNSPLKAALEKMIPGKN